MAEQLYFYDEQIRRYLLQFVRLFSGFSVKTDKTLEDGTPYYVSVPVRYGDASRMATLLNQESSENIVASTPFMSCYINSLDMDRERTQEPYYQDTISVIERKFDEETQSYVNVQGNKYSVRRLMPVPYRMEMMVDVWTSNTDQKLQLFEQISVLYNPSLDIQSSSSPVDWTAITTVEMTGVTWSNKSIPVGTDETIDVLTLTFTVPIWVNPPALVSSQKIIRHVIDNIYDDTSQIMLEQFDPNAVHYFDQFERMETIIVTPENFGLEMYESNGEVFAKPLRPGNYDDDIVWQDVIDYYGTFNDGASRLRLKWHGELEDLSNDAIGVLTSTTDPGVLKFIVDNDTLPTDTFAPVDRIIDSRTARPGFNGFPTVAVGQRYLSLTSSTAESNYFGIDIDTDDIIEYNGSEWIISFDASSYTGTGFVTNLYTDTQYRFINGAWQNTFLGLYEAGYWRLELLG